MTRAKRLPEFKTEAEERDFWKSRDASEYVDWRHSRSQPAPIHKPANTTIAIRLPETLLERIKLEATKRDIPYQSLIKDWLAEDVEQSREK
ncbi:MAG: BrnA antitoxin family protein [Pseudomonadota bacterium]